MTSNYIEQIRQQHKEREKLNLNSNFTNWERKIQCPK